MPRLLMAIVLMFTAALPGVAQEKAKPAANDPIGLWLGVLKVGPVELRLAFAIDKDKEGKFSGKMTSIFWSDTLL